VSYQGEGNSNQALFSVPIEVEGPTTLHQGEMRTPGSIYAQLTAQRRQAICASKLERVSASDAQAASMSGEWAWTPTYAPGGGIRVTALVPRKAARTWEDPCRDPKGQRSTFPAGSIVLLLPDEQPRPAGDVAAARAVAVLATPATLALDVVEFAAVAAILVPMVALGLAPNC